FIRAVEDAGFPVIKGSVVGVVGESGCGKTVTALSMMGLLDSEPGVIEGNFFFKSKPQDTAPIEHSLIKKTKKPHTHKRGDMINLFYGLDNYVHFENNPFTIIKDSEKWMRKVDSVMENIRGKNISMIFQNPKQSLNPFVKVGEQLERTIMRFSSHQDHEEASERALELLRSVRLYNPELVKEMYPQSLSAGMAQRVIIAIALASSPKLLIADEPTTGLDTTNKYRIIDLLGTLMSQMDLTLIFISHNVKLVQLIATHIVVMYAGMVVEMGPKKNVITRRGPKHPYTEALVSAIPTDSDIKKGRKLRPILGSVPNNKVSFHSCPYLDRCVYAQGRIRRICDSRCPGLVKVDNEHYIRCYLGYR
ncbi:MAG: ABC transporter ATP-binding protein, partial [Spirochaetota bacterium]